MGLSRKQIAKRLDCSYATVCNYAREYDISIKDGRYNSPPKVSVLDHGEIDWSMTDSQIAKIMGISRERVRQYRKEKRLAKSINKGVHAETIALRRAIADQIHRSGCVTAPELNQIIGANASDWKIKHHAKAVGFEIAKKVKGGKTISSRKRLEIIDVNWTLPNKDIDTIWRLSHNSAGKYRSDNNLPPPKWNIQFGHNKDNPSYRQAVQNEIKKAEAYFSKLN